MVLKWSPAFPGVAAHKSSVESWCPLRFLLLRWPSGSWQDRPEFYSNLSHGGLRKKPAHLVVKQTAGGGVGRAPTWLESRLLPAQDACMPNEGSLLPSIGHFRVLAFRPLWDKCVRSDLHFAFLAERCQTPIIWHGNCPLIPEKFKQAGSFLGSKIAGLPSY